MLQIIKKLQAMRTKDMKALATELEKSLDDHHRRSIGAARQKNTRSTNRRVRSKNSVSRDSKRRS